MTPLLRAPQKVLSSLLFANSIEIANRLIDTLTDRFFMLAGFPYVGRARDDDFGPGCRSVAVGEYVIVYCVENVEVLILRVAHGRRDLEALFDH
ncbi:MAG: type II toxin-antitoxin system RelE/ParE family toxin [Terriglobia bacterium]